MKKCFVSMLLATSFFFCYVNFAEADVCFLPDDKNCIQMPYRENIDDCVGQDCSSSDDSASDDANSVPECDKENFCYDTEEEAKNSRTSAYDSYSESGNCWCLESSVCSSAYSSKTPKGENWICPQCHVINSQYYENYDNSSCICGLSDEKQGYKINTTTCQYESLP